MKKIDPFASKPKKKGPQYKNFIEAFKDIGKSTVKTLAKDVVGGTAKGVVDSLTQNQAQTDSDQPQEKFNFEDYLKNQEKHIKNQERSRFEAIRREEKVLFSREKQQVKIQIQTIQTQIQEMAKEHTGLIKEIQHTSFQAVVNPGVYHKNFFERLSHLIKIARQKIADSRSWLQLHNHRSQKKSHYWGQVKKSGTNFMLSGERTVATQTG